MHCCYEEWMVLTASVPFIGVFTARVICFCQRCIGRRKDERSEHHHHSLDRDG
jgi:hypothetical protein